MNKFSFKFDSFTKKTITWNAFVLSLIVLNCRITSNIPIFIVQVCLFVSVHMYVSMYVSNLQYSFVFYRKASMTFYRWRNTFVVSYIISNICRWRWRQYEQDYGWCISLEGIYYHTSFLPIKKKTKVVQRISN